MSEFQISPINSLKCPLSILLWSHTSLSLITLLSPSSHSQIFPFSMPFFSSLFAAFHSVSHIRITFSHRHSGGTSWNSEMKWKERQLNVRIGVEREFSSCALRAVYDSQRLWEKWENGERERDAEICDMFPFRSSSSPHSYHQIQPLFAPVFYLNSLVF